MDADFCITRQEVTAMHVTYIMNGQRTRLFQDSREALEFFWYLIECGVKATISK